MHAEKPVDLHLILTDASGREIRDFKNVTVGPSDYSLPLSSAILPSGEYFLRAIASGATIATTKVLVMR